MKLIKVIFTVVFVLVLLAIAVPVCLMIFVNPNQFKPQIEKEVQSAIHQPFAIKGNLKWTFYPMAGIQAKGVTLGQNLLSAKSIEFSVAVAPLLHKEIRVGKIQLDGLDLNLIKNAAGQANWNIIPDASHAPKKSTSSHPNKASDDDAKIAAWSVSQISIRNSEISLDDATQNKHLKITNFNFSSANVSVDKAFPVSVSMTVASDTFASPVNVKWKSNLAYINSTKTVKLTNINATLNDDLTLTGTESITLGNPLRWQAKVDLNNINIQNLLKLFKKNSLDISGMGDVSASLGGAGSISTLNGNLKFAVNNGVFHGLDLYYYSDVADSISNKQAPKLNNTRQTPFGTLTGTAQINNGVLSNNDLLIKASKINATGQGTANLNSQQLNYRMSLQRMTSDSEIKPRGPAIPITITGNFAKPSVSVDVASLAASEVKQVIADKVKEYGPEINKKIQEGLSSLLGN
ncbi:MAG: AsmA family protein [Gammaproteobacteria bacterium]|nr:AsmA family protein [Gammaproteobacteria bacterium]